jgi:hypothetical protein
MDIDELVGCRFRRADLLSGGLPMPNEHWLERFGRIAICQVNTGQGDQGSDNEHECDEVPHLDRSIATKLHGSPFAFSIRVFQSTGINFRLRTRLQPETSQLQIQPAPR